jgi:hypothetical protein
MTRPVNGVADLLHDWEEDKKIDAELRDAARKDEHLNSCFTSGMRETLIAEMAPLIGQTGFRPSFVASMAACVYVEAVGIEVASWHPSPSWTYKFMRDELGCAFRRGTTSRPDLEKIEETDALHMRNLQRIAILRADGFEDWQFMTNDQFGCHLFPQHRGVWAKKGSIDVFVENLEDKRQYTGNICSSGDGEVRF